MSPSFNASSELGGWIRLVFCAAGIYAAYLTQGVIQERLQTHTYGPENERFPELTFLQGAQGLACFLVGAILLFLGQRLGLIESDSSKGNGAAKKFPNVDEYLKCAVSNTIGPACGILALKNISYPAQVLAKSCKPLAVMISGAIFYRKRYSAVEYGCISAVAAGISLFAFKGSSHAAKRLQNPNAMLGYSLCAINLLLDGFTNANQDDITHRYPNVTPLHLMTWINFWMSALAAYVYFLAGNTGHKIIDFCIRHPSAMQEVAMFCACGAVGQLFIFLSIRSFGSLTNTTITTTRKFFNILLSVVWNGTVLLPAQWIGALMVLGGLMASAVYKDAQRRKLKTAPSYAPLPASTKEGEAAATAVKSPEGTAVRRRTAAAAAAATILDREIPSSPRESPKSLGRTGGQKAAAEAAVTPKKSKGLELEAPQGAATNGTGHEANGEGRRRSTRRTAAKKE